MAPSGTSMIQHHQEANAAFQQGDYQKAAEEFSLARQEYSQLKEDSLAAEMSSNQSVALLFAGYPELALEAAQQASSFFSHGNEKQKYGIALGNQASALDAMGKTQEAEAIYKEAADLLQESGDREDAAAALKKLSSFYLGRLLIAKSLVSYRSALDLSDKLSAWDKIFLSLMNKIPGLIAK